MEDLQCMTENKKMSCLWWKASTSAIHLFSSWSGTSLYFTTKILAFLFCFVLIWFVLIFIQAYLWCHNIKARHKRVTAELSQNGTLTYKALEDSCSISKHKETETFTHTQNSGRVRQKIWRSKVTYWTDTESWAGLQSNRRTTMFKTLFAALPKYDSGKCEILGESCSCFSCTAKSFFCFIFHKTDVKSASL